LYKTEIFTFSEILRCLAVLTPSVYNSEEKCDTRRGEISRQRGNKRLNLKQSRRNI